MPIDGMNVSEKPERIDAIDALRAIGLIMIVLVHVSVSLFLKAPLYSSRWWSANLYEGLRSGTVLFFFVSGMILLKPERSEPVGVFLKRRFVRVIGPSLVWIVLYYAYDVWHLSYTTYWRDVIKFILAGPVHYHLWFIYALIPIYLAVPVLRVIVRKENENILRYLLGLFLLGITVAPLLERLLDNTSPALIVTMFANYSGFFVAGSYFYWIRPPFLQRPRRPLLWLAAAWVVVYAVTVVGTYLLNRFGQRPDQFLHDRGGINMIVMNFAVFIILTRLDYAGIYRRAPWLKKVVTVLAKSSFSVYLLHVILLEQIPLLSQRFLGVRIDESLVHPLLGIPLFSGLVIGLSVLLVFLLSRVPVVKFLFRYD
jgi:surface polysaccharide O-acyltransferase-like enzyme